MVENNTLFLQSLNFGMPCGNHIFSQLLLKYRMLVITRRKATSCSYRRPLPNGVTVICDLREITNKVYRSISHHFITIFKNCNGNRKRVLQLDCIDSFYGPSKSMASEYERVWRTEIDDFHLIIAYRRFIPHFEARQSE